MNKKMVPWNKIKLTEEEFDDLMLDNWVEIVRRGLQIIIEYNPDTGVFTTTLPQVDFIVLRPNRRKLK